MQKEVESEAFFWKIVILLILIVSVVMLIFSYKIEHGEILEPLKKQFEVVTKQVKDVFI